MLQEAGRLRPGLAMRIIQFEHPPMGRCLGVVQGEEVVNITARAPALTGVYAAFRAARGQKQRLVKMLEALLRETGDRPALAYADLLVAGRVLAPVTEDTGTRLLVSGTGLTHLGSMQQRDAMHKQAESSGPKSDSRKMFEMGLEGGRPAPGQRG